MWLNLLVSTTLNLAVMKWWSVRRCFTAKKKKNVNAVRSTPNFIFRGCQSSIFVLNNFSVGKFTREHITSFKTGKSTEREKLEVEYVSQIKLTVTLLNVYWLARKRATPRAKQIMRINIISLKSSMLICCLGVQLSIHLSSLMLHFCLRSKLLTNAPEELRHEKTSCWRCLHVWWTDFC